MSPPGPPAPPPDDRTSRLYVAYLHHLQHCTQDHLTTRCAEGTGLRRAWREAQAASLRALRAPRQRSSELY